MADDSILNSIKKLLGIEADYDVFDTDITIHINTVFSVLHSIGASPPDVFYITGDTEKWSDFLLDVAQARMVQTYMYLKVRNVFDPPSSASVATAFENQAKELEWRLAIMEFSFNPESKPIDDVRENRLLALLNEKVEDLDEELDSVPDLNQIYHENLGH